MRLGVRLTLQTVNATLRWGPTTPTTTNPRRSTLISKLYPTASCRSLTHPQCRGSRPGNLLIPRSGMIRVMNQQVLESTTVSTRSHPKKERRNEGGGGPMSAHLWGERPITKCSNDQSPIPDIQLPDLLVHVDAFLRWKIRVCERFEKGLSTRSQRPAHEGKKKGGSQVNINIVILTGHRGGERSHVPNSSLQTLPFQHKQPPQTIIPLFQRRAPDELSLMRQHAHSHHRMPYPPTIGFFRWFVRLEHRRVEMFVVRE